ncbi:MAG TPA: ribbon-helix-helix protein, CopG family [Thermoanaerobaculia bacterium]|nr:ribbon-helix-helix protein, CopG family [Thermoanaerobaculia bacterium]
MAAATIKATYSLDPGTVCRLEEIARHWGISKSEALRRAIRAAAVGPAAGPSEPLAALDALQRGAALTPAAARAWATEARKERRASSTRPGKSTR